MAGGKIYLREGSSLVPMRETPYDLEEVLQKLLADYPDLLAGDQIRPSEPRRWLLITREAGIAVAVGGASVFALDHLFLDQDATPTLVEVKRSADTRLRREVVGQMLDYAANVVAFWPRDRIRDLFETRARAASGDPDEAVLDLLGRSASTESDSDAGDAIDEFWRRAGENLANGRLRLLFVADQIPPELQRIIEFLNRNMARVDVLGVEIKQYKGEGRETLVPRVVGLTGDVIEKDGSGGPPSPAEQQHAEFWTQFMAYQADHRLTPRIAGLRRGSTASVGLGRAGFNLKPWRTLDNQSGCYVYLSPPNAKTHFDRIEEGYRSVIEERLRPLGTVKWEREPWPNAIHSTISLRHDVALPADEPWPELIEWLAHAFQTMFEVLVPIVRTLPVSSHSAHGGGEAGSPDAPTG
jgi:hypothetical protein